MKKLIIITLTCMLGAPLVTSCSTVMHGPNQNVVISSTPQNAHVIIDGMPYGCTPTVTKLERKRNHHVRIDLPGYEPYETVLTYSVSKWFFGNILIGGVPGMIVDAVTGAMYKLTPAQICAELSKCDSALSVSERGDELMIAITLRSCPEWEEIGRLKKL